MPRYLVTLVVPIHNIEAYVGACLRSLTDQTHADIEILAVNDGSTDSSGNIAHACAARDPRIQVIDQANGGLSAARNVGIARAKGDYIAFVDGDDWVERTYVAALLEAATTTNSDITVCGFTRSGPRTSETVALTDHQLCLSPHEAVRQLLLRRPGLVEAWNKLYHRSIFASPVARYPVGVLYEDTHATYRLLDLAQTVCLIPDALYHYRRRQGSILRSPIGPEGAGDYLGVLDSLDSWVSLHGDDLRPEFESFRAHRHLFLVSLISRFGESEPGVSKRALRWISSQWPALKSNPYLDQHTRRRLALAARSATAYQALLWIAQRTLHWRHGDMWP
jgi:glycosyltransferase involved in cell wall biosynthesis